MFDRSAGVDYASACVDVSNYRVHGLAGREKAFVLALFYGGGLVCIIKFILDGAP